MKTAPPSGSPPQGNPAIGGVEFLSIAKGILATDLMLKAAQVQLLLSRSICSGKFLALVSGDTAAVSAAVDQGISCGAFSARCSCH